MLTAHGSRVTKTASGRGFVISRCRGHSLVSTDRWDHWSIVRLIWRGCKCGTRVCVVIKATATSEHLLGPTCPSPRSKTSTAPSLFLNTYRGRGAWRTASISGRPRPRALTSFLQTSQRAELLPNDSTQQKYATLGMHEALSCSCARRVTLSGVTEGILQGLRTGLAEPQGTRHLQILASCQVPRLAIQADQRQMLRPRKRFVARVSVTEGAPCARSSREIQNLKLKSVLDLRVLKKSCKRHAEEHLMRVRRNDSRIPDFRSPRSVPASTTSSGSDEVSGPIYADFDSARMRT